MPTSAYNHLKTTIVEDVVLHGVDKYAYVYLYEDERQRLLMIDYFHSEGPTSDFLKDSFPQRFCR